MMEYLDAAVKEPLNEDPVRRFAIKTARDILIGAGVIGPNPNFADRLSKQVFSHFGKTARTALTFAEREASNLKHQQIGTEHVLLGCSREENCGQILKQFGLDETKIRRTLVFIVGMGNVPVTEPINPTLRAVKAMELAVEEAERLRHKSISSTHLLFGLLKEGGGIAGGILEGNGVNLNNTRDALLDYLKTQQPTQE